MCFAKGFVANGLNCGINPVKESLTLVLFIVRRNAMRLVSTLRIKVKGAPIIVTKKAPEKSGGKGKGCYR